MRQRCRELGLEKGVQHSQAHREAQDIPHRVPQQRVTARTRAWPKAPSTLLSWDGQTMKVSKPLEQPNLYLPFPTLSLVRTQTQRSNLLQSLQVRKPRLPSQLTAPK